MLLLLYFVLGISNFFLFIALYIGQGYQIISLFIVSINLIIFFRFRKSINFSKAIVSFLFLIFFIPFLLSFFTLFSETYLVIFPKLVMRFSFFLLGMAFYIKTAKSNDVNPHLFIISYLVIVYFALFTQFFNFPLYKDVLSLVGANADAFLTTGRFMGWIGQSNQFAYSLFLFIPVGFYLVGRWFYLYALFLIFPILLSGSRTVFIMVSLLFISDIIRMLFNFNVKTSVTVIFISFGFFLLWNELSKGDFLAIERLKIDFDSLNSDNSLEERKSGRDAYLTKILDSPEGHGFGSDAFYMKHDSSFVLSAHSDLIRDAYEYGIIYALSLIVAWLVILKKMFFSRQYFSLSVFMLVFIAYLFAGNVRDINIFYFYLAITFCILNERKEIKK